MNKVRWGFCSEQSWARWMAEQRGLRLPFARRWLASSLARR